ncbi:acetyl-CoA carboxylase biotin carboxyl carrier protein subunit [Crocinitomicaceae bacterium]|jgi:biotin carboxyl carrier protein|nr:acetyl-CoA carboxylase biotin carboxyl carrier protein subunit [Crocinitomicaceae bacterium]MDB4648662.1 acetyl-CoA carboxylase biotin carboxyl carrier protein subunit [Crocinitomicaceae bacterium]
MAEEKKFIVDGLEIESRSGADILWKSRDFFELIYKGQSFKGEIVKRDIENKKLTLKLNHRVFEIQKKFELDALIAKLGLDKVKVKQLKELESPMPGRILSVQVKAGDHVKVGDPILSLEAMKMENILKSDGEGIVKSVAIKKEEVVDKGQLLIEFE